MTILHVFAIRNPKFDAERIMLTKTHSSNEAIKYETHLLACTTCNLMYQKAHLLFDTHWACLWWFSENTPQAGCFQNIQPSECISNMTTSQWSTLVWLMNVLMFQFSLFLFLCFMEEVRLRIISLAIWHLMIIIDIPITAKKQKRKQKWKK